MNRSKNHKITTQSPIHKALSRANSSSNWFKFRRDYFRSGIMTKREAMFFQDLVNKAGMEKTKRTEDGFFLCTSEFLTKSSSWTRRQQAYLFKQLEEKGFVRREVRGCPARRWIFLDHEKIEILLSRYEITVVQNCTTGCDKMIPTGCDKMIPTTYIRRTKEEDTPPTPPKGEGVLFSNGVTQEKKLADKLYAELRQHGKIPDLKDSKERILLRWMKSFRKTLKDGVYSFDQIEDPMSTHAAHVGEDYWPHAVCGHDYCNKLPSIINAIHRLNKKERKVWREVEGDPGNFWLPESEIW